MIDGHCLAHTNDLPTDKYRASAPVPACRISGDTDLHTSDFDERLQWSGFIEMTQMEVALTK